MNPTARIRLAQPRIASYTSGRENASSVAIRRYGHGKLTVYLTLALFSARLRALLTRLLPSSLVPRSSVQSAPRPWLAHGIAAMTSRTALVIFDSSGRMYSSIGWL